MLNKGLLNVTATALENLVVDGIASSLDRISDKFMDLYKSADGTQAHFEIYEALQAEVSHLRGEDIEDEDDEDTETDEDGI